MTPQDAHDLISIVLVAIFAIALATALIMAAC